ncbi:MAG: substrate-binding domain-containing protein [bacterium]|nr:substrate-binding domain-containing protein [bacterium]
MSKTLWKTIVGTLRAEITDNDMRVGERFSSRDEICSRFDVSTITARRVLDELEAEGWVKKYKYRGTFVARNASPVSVNLILDCSGSNGIPSEISALQSFPRLIRIIDEFKSAADRSGVDLQVITRVYNNDINGQNLIVLDNYDLPRDLLKLTCSKNNVVLTHAVNKAEHVNAVRLDMDKGARLAVKHLVSLGHKRIGFVLTKVTDDWQIPRCIAYEEVLKRNGIAFDWHLIKETINLGRAEICTAMDRLMKLEQPPTAVFAGNDEIALTIIQYCRERNIDVPGKLSIVGLDNNPDASIVSPGLTTVDNRLDLMAEETLRIIVAADDGRKEIRDVLIPPELIIRESTAPPAVGSLI